MVSAEQAQPSRVISSVSSLSCTVGWQHWRTVCDHLDSQTAKAQRPVELAFAGTVSDPPCLEKSLRTYKSTGLAPSLSSESLGKVEYKEE